MSEHDHDDETEHGGCGCNHDHENPWPTRSLAVAAVFNVVALVTQWTHVGPSILPKALAGVAVVLGGWFLIPGAWEAARRLRPNISQNTS